MPRSCVLALAFCLALSAPTAVPAQAPAAQAAPPRVPAWVEQSNAHAQILLAAQAPFQPEFASFFGVPGYDGLVADLRLGNGERFRAATARAKTELPLGNPASGEAARYDDFNFKAGRCTPKPRWCRTSRWTGS